MDKLKLIRNLRKIAKDKGLTFVKVREGRHEIWEIGSQKIQIPATTRSRKEQLPRS